MKGVQFLADGRGETTGVLLDLRHHRRLWEDIYDTWIAEHRKDEPRVAWKDVKRRLKTKKRRA
jgi:hypothetical protein